jgi:hypothetical protein
VREKVAVEQRLALLGQAQRVVDFGARLARHQRAQELHVGRGHFHVDHEVGAREAEQHLQVVFAEQRGVDVELARLSCRIGSENGISLKPLMILPTTYAPLLRKNSPDSTCSWKLARSLTW